MDKQRVIYPILEQKETTNKKPHSVLQSKWAVTAIVVKDIYSVFKRDNYFLHKTFPLICSPSSGYF